MRLYQSILFVALAASLAACGWIDPESIDDPVDETTQRLVKISVGSEPDTKFNVNVEENDGVRQGVVTFTENDKLFLFETKEPMGGSASTSIIPSTGTVLKNGGKSADFFFLFTSSTGAEIPIKSLTYIAAAGEWSLNENNGNMEVDIPASFNMEENGESLLPQKGVIAMSDPYSGTPSEANKIFTSNVRLNHLVSYGILNITGLPGKTITEIKIERTSSVPLAGKATIKLEKNSAYTDVSDGTSGAFVLSPLSLKDDSAKAISITPSDAVQDSIRDNTGTSIWLSSVPSSFSSPETLNITLTDDTSKTYHAQFSFDHAINAGYPALIDISSWSE